MTSFLENDVWIIPLRMIWYCSLGMIIESFPENDDDNVPKGTMIVSFPGNDNWNRSLEWL